MIAARGCDEGAYEEAAKVKNAEDVETELKTVEDIIREI